MKISKTIWIYLFVGILVVGGFIIGMSYKSQSAERDTLKSQLSTAEKRSNAIPLQDLTNQESSLKNQVANVNSQITTLKSNLSQSTDYLNIVKTMYSLANDSGLVIENISSKDSTVKKVNDIAFSSYPLSIEVNGSLESINTFVKKITEKYSTGVVDPVQVDVKKTTVTKSPYTWEVPMGAQLPSWLKLDSATGEIYGTPDTIGTYNFSVQVNDGLGHNFVQALSITVNPLPEMNINEIVLEDGYVSYLYKQLLKPSGGACAPVATPAIVYPATSVVLPTPTPKYTFEVAAGSPFPSWARLDTSTGEITGIPETSGVWKFQITVKDAVNNSSAVYFSLTVNPVPGLGINESQLPDAELKNPYKQTLAVSDGIESPDIIIETATTTANISVNILSY